MKKTFSLLFFAVLVIAHASCQGFTLKSNSMGGQATTRQLFNGLGVNGENISPQLLWQNPPQGTKSFAVTMYDPTAPTGSGWWHWVVFDIPVTCHELKEGSGSPEKQFLPEGAVQGVNDLGKTGYMGPAPPPGSGIHPYMITVYALGVEKLGLDKTAGPALVGFYINSNAIEKASILMYCKR